MLKFIQYLHYFIQSIKNRGFGFTFRLLWEEWRGENESGIKTLKIENLQGMNLGHSSIEETHHYQGASYYILKNLFGHLDQKLKEKEFVDLGCGKGRALILAAQFGFKKIRGIEIAEELCKNALENWVLVKNKFPGVLLNVEQMNASKYQANNETGVIYLFNPFPEKVMMDVIQNIKKHCQSNTETRIVYVNPLYLNSWLENGFEIEHEMRSKRYCEGVILKTK